MATSSDSGLLGAAVWLALGALLFVVSRSRSLRPCEAQRPISAAGVGARVSVAALLSGGALVCTLRALSALPIEIALPEPWAGFARGEALVAVGLVLLLGFADFERERAWLLLGAGVSAVTAWTGARALATVGLEIPLSHDAAALAGAVVAALVLAPGRRERRVSRLRREASGAAAIHVLVADRSGGLLYAGDAARQALALPPPRPWRARELLPQALREIVTGDKQEAQRIRTAAGLIFEARLVGRPQGLRRARALVLRDVTEDHRHKRRLFQLAHHDSLTGLANRRLFLERLKKLVSLDATDADRAALLYIDLDGFKAINDTLGHGVGDALLSELADRFRTHLRPEELARLGIETEASPMVARLAGDEFAIVVPGVQDKEAAAGLARFLIELIRRPLDLPDRTLNPSASIGIALLPAHGHDVETVLQHADSALYVAKSRGRQCFALYEASLEEKADRKRLIEEGLRTALERREISLHYQPKVDTHTNEVVGFEALMRWRSASLGEVGPSEFIPVAEEQRGVIAALGAWGLDETCRQIRAWKDSGFVIVPVSVNVSSAQFAESDLQRVVSECLDRHGVDPQSLELELTESLLLDERSQAEQVLRDLRSIGVRIALDDFGTGYSALTYLNRFSLDVLKMDRGLLREIDADPSALGIATAVVAMAHSLGLHVVAEGVDAAEQLSLLRRMDCDQIQGFLFAPALPAAEVARFLRRKGAPPVRLAPGMVAPGRRPGAAQYQAGEPTPLAGETSASEVTPIVAPARAAGRVLVVDDARQPLATTTMRLVNLGIDVHYASAIDEARLFVGQEDAGIRLLVSPPSVDLAQARRFRESLAEDDGGARSWLVVGERPDDRIQEAIREAGVDWVLWAPFSDAELRYVTKAAMAQRAGLAARREVRVPVDLVGRLQCGDRREVVVVSSLSARGAFLEMEAPLTKGNSLRIEIDLGSDCVRAFARVAYVAQANDAQPTEPSGVGISFYGLDRTEERLLRKAVSERQLRYLP
jgi:diguanylate cyclase (GGDEF)-like protein